MIRDRLIVGIRDKRLSKQLQMDAELMLEKAVIRIRQSELVKKQQDLLKNNFKQENPCNVDVIKEKVKHFKPRKTVPQNTERNVKSQCSRCGKTPFHSKNLCPAKEVLCNQCKKKGHYARACRSGAVGEIRAAGGDSEEREVAFLGTVASERNEDAWLTKIKVNNVDCWLKIDTGADVTVLPEKHKNHSCNPQI